MIKSSIVTGNAVDTIKNLLEGSRFTLTNEADGSLKVTFEGAKIYLKIDSPTVSQINGVNNTIIENASVVQGNIVHYIETANHFVFLAQNASNYTTVMYGGFEFKEPGKSPIYMTLRREYWFYDNKIGVLNSINTTISDNNAILINAVVGLLSTKQADLDRGYVNTSAPGIAMPGVQSSIYVMSGVTVINGASFTITCSDGVIRTFIRAFEKYAIAID